MEDHSNSVRIQLSTMTNTKSKELRVTLQFVIVLIVVAYSFAEESIEVWLHPVSHNWFSAYEICRWEGRQLLAIHNEEEIKQINALSAKYKLSSSWLAATDLGHEGQFVWATTGIIVPPIYSSGWSNLAPIQLPN